MAKPGAKFAVAICAGIAGSCILALLAPAAVVAAEDCLTEPNAKTSDGQHWYYRSDRGTNRRCWYMKDGADRQAQPPSSWDFAQPAAPNFAPRRSEKTGPRASSDALAEMPPLRARVDSTVNVSQKPQLPINALSADRTALDGSFAQGPTRDLGGSPSTLPFDRSTTDLAPTSATMMVDNPAPDPDSNSNATPDTTDSTGAAAPKPPKAVAPIHKLLMVVVGALALSGLLASGLYRLSKVGRRRRRDANWQMAIARTRRSRAKSRVKSKIKTPPSRGGQVALRPVRAPAGDLVAAPADRPAAGLVDRLDTGLTMPTPRTPGISSARSRGAQPRDADVAIAASLGVDPAAELENLLAARRPAKAAIHNASQAPVAAEQAASKAIDTAEEMVNLLESELARPAARPTDVTATTHNADPAVPPAEATAGRNDIATAKNIDAVAQLADALQLRGATPIRPPAQMAAVPSAAPPPPAAGIPPPQPVDPTEELAQYLETLVPKPDAPPANAGAVHGAVPLPAIADIPLPNLGEPIEQPVAYRETGVAKPAARPTKAARSSVPPSEMADIAPSKLVDPAEGQVKHRRARAAKPAERPAKAAAARAAAARVMADIAPSRPVDSIESVEPVERQLDHLERRDVPPATRPAHPAAARGTYPPPTAADRLPSSPVDPSAEQTGNPGSHAAKPAARQARVPASRVAEPAPFTLPPIPSDSDDDAQSPPLDFIPRPQALRPRVRSVRQDQSLDGIEDILARLGRHAKS